MFFLNIALLLGLLAISIPVLIHLFNRSAAKTVSWGAMHFLRQSMVTRRRRILLEAILLLVARCLLIGLLALAMARPFVPEGSPIPWAVVLPLALLGIALLAASFALWRYPVWRRRCTIAALSLMVVVAALIALEKWLHLSRFGGGESKDIAILIDGSTSMTLATEGRVNFERAVSEAAELVRAAPRRNAFSILVAGAAPHALIPAPVSDRKEVLSALETAKPVLGTLRAPDALLAAAVTLAQGYNPTKQIVIITDGQRAGWDTDHPSRWDLVGRAFKNLPVVPQVVLRTFSLPTHYRNLALDAIDLSRKVVGTDREIAIQVRVSNTGTEAVTPSRVELTIHDETFENRTITQLRPGATETVSFPYHFKAAGAAALTARVVVDDDLPGDNTAARAVNVVDRLRVLIVDGNPAARFMERAAAFPALALAPAPGTARDTPAAAKAGQGLLVEPVIVDAARLAATERFDDYHVLILADVPRLPASQADRLARYAARGGGILVAPGPRALPDFYNAWSLEGHGAVLPARLRERITLDADSEPLRLAPATLQHAALLAAMDGDRGDIVTCRIEACWALDPLDAAASVSIGGRLNTGDPFLVEHALGRGLVMMTALSLDTRGSNLATLQAFVPFMHEAVYHLANPSAPHLNLEPGRAMVLRLPRRPGAPRGTADAPTAALPCAAIDPDGAARTASLQIDPHGATARIEGAAIPGLYRFYVPEAHAARLAWVTSADGSIPITVQHDAHESDLKPLVETDHAMLEQRLDMVSAASLDDVRSVLAGQAFGHELWRTLALAAFVLVVLEIVLTRWITARRKTGREKPIDFEAQTTASASFREQLAAMRSSHGT